MPSLMNNAVYLSYRVEFVSFNVSRHSKALVQQDSGVQFPLGPLKLTLVACSFDERGMCTTPPAHVHARMYGPDLLRHSPVAVCRKRPSWQVVLQLPSCRDASEGQETQPAWEGPLQVRQDGWQAGGLTADKDQTQCLSVLALLFFDLFCLIQICC